MALFGRLLLLMTLLVTLFVPAAFASPTAPERAEPRHQNLSQGAAAGISVDDFVARYRGRLVDVDGVPAAQPYQCTDLFNKFHSEVLGGSYVRMDISGGAKDLWSTSNAQITATYDRVAATSPARKGDVAVWSGSKPYSGGYGHVSIVLADRGSTLSTFSQNPGASDIRDDSKAHLLGYLRPKQLPGSEPADADRDGVPDATDACPREHGPRTTGGCPDTDGDEVRDLDDRCRTVRGLSAARGCPEDMLSQSDPGRPVDVSGDGRADFCRRIGSVNGADSQVACTLSTRNGFGQTRASGVLDWGYDFGRAWVDVNADDRADFCRVVGDSTVGTASVACTLTTGSGFGRTYGSAALDWGYDVGRAWVDVNGDDRADYCRRVGNQNGVDSKLACTLMTKNGFGPTRTTPVLDWGYDNGRAWVDVNADERADFCRVVGDSTVGTASVACTLSTASGFGRTHWSPALDWGYETGRAWVDVNADDRVDFCRRVGGPNNIDSKVACTLMTPNGFGPTRASSALDWGYEAGRAWVDVNADDRADFCRVVGDSTLGVSKVGCTLSTKDGFGVTRWSPNLDWGFNTGRAWVDVNADDRADYCRRVGSQNGVDSKVICTLSTKNGFGSTRSSSVLDWGYDTGRSWVG